ncbi:MAG: glycosyltransferase family 4 protein, partial [Pseudomonadota bacterium]
FGTNSATVAMLAAMLDEERTFSVTVHGPEEFDKPGLISLPEKIKSAAFVAGVSSFGVSQLRRHADFDDWDKLAQVHCGIERSFWEGAPAKQFGSKTFVSVGRLAEQKGQMTLVRACGLLKERGRTFSLRLVGDGELRGPLEAAITDLGLKDSVQILGWKTPTQVREEILKARAFVLPSYAEGLPVSIMEAFSLNTPVISSYVAGIPELVRPGENGWLAPAADEEALADAMADCLDASEQKLAEMGRAGKARTLERHDMDTIAAQLARLFRPYAAPTDSAPEKPIPNADQKSVEEEAA